MSRYEHGRVLAVNETTLGSELVGDHAAGVGSLTVEDPVDFDEDGGWLRIADQVVEYSTYDDDTGEITLRGTLDAAAGEGDRVDLWDELRQVVTVDKIAQVELDGDDDNTDPLEAVIPLHLLDDLAEGIRGVRGESVLLEQDGDEWRIVDVLGLAAQGASGTQFWNDLHTVTATGQQTIALTHEPIDNSEHLYWNGLYQPASEWSRNGQTITVPDSGGHLAAGDELTVEYAYRVGIASTTAQSLFSTGIDNPVIAPTGVEAGMRLLLAITLPSGHPGASNLNGYTLLGETAEITHQVGNSTGGTAATPLTYRLALYTRTAPGGAVPVPEFPAHASDTVYVFAALTADSVSTSAFGTVADAQTANTPNLPGATVHVFATLGVHQTITADSIQAEFNGDPQINICIAVDATDSATAQVQDTAGWMLASIGMGGIT